MPSSPFVIHEDRMDRVPLRDVLRFRVIGVSCHDQPVMLVHLTTVPIGSMYGIYANMTGVY